MVSSIPCCCAHATSKSRSHRWMLFHESTGKFTLLNWLITCAWTSRLGSPAIKNTLSGTCSLISETWIKKLVSEPVSMWGLRVLLSKYPPTVFRCWIKFARLAAPVPLPPSNISDKLACGHISAKIIRFSGFCLAYSQAIAKDKYVFPTPPLLFQIAYDFMVSPALSAVCVPA